MSEATLQKSRHPKPFRFKQKCKYFAQNICVFKHVTSAWDDVEGIATLKSEIESLKLENKTKLSKLFSLEEEVKSLNLIKNTSEESNSLKVLELEKQLDSFKFKIEALEKEKEMSTKLVKELKETIALLETDNVDLKVQNIIKQAGAELYQAQFKL